MCFLWLDVPSAGGVWVGLSLGCDYAPPQGSSVVMGVLFLSSGEKLYRDGGFDVCVVMRFSQSACSSRVMPSWLSHGAWFYDILSSWFAPPSDNPWLSTGIWIYECVCVSARVHVCTYHGVLIVELVGLVVAFNSLTAQFYTLCP